MHYLFLIVKQNGTSQIVVQLESYPQLSSVHCFFCFVCLQISTIQTVERLTVGLGACEAGGWREAILQLNGTSTCPWKTCFMDAQKRSKSQDGWEHLLPLVCREHHCLLFFIHWTISWDNKTTFQIDLRT